MLNTISENKQNQQALDKTSSLIGTTLQAPSINANIDNVVTLTDILAMLYRRGILIGFFLFLTTAFTLIYSLTLEPSYQAKAMIQIDPEGTQIVEFGQIRKPNDVYDLQNDPAFRTRYEILRGRFLAQKVIDKLQLQKVFEKKNTGLIYSLKTQLSQKLESLNSFFVKSGIQKKSDDHSNLNTPIDYVSHFQSKLFVKPIQGSYLVEIFYEAPSPEIAKEVVSTLIASFINFQLESNSETDEYATKFLAGQIINSAKRLSKAEGALSSYSNKTGILKVDDQQISYLKKLENLDLAMVAAEIDKIKKENQYTQVQQAGVIPASLSHPFIYDLKADSYRKENEYQQMLKSFQPRHPQMKNLQQQIAATKNKIETEFMAIKTSMKVDFLTAKSQVESIREKLGLFKQELYQLQNSNLEYTRLKREVTISEKLHNSLLQRLEEVSVAAAALSSNIRVIEPPMTPQNKHRPRIKINLIIGLMSGLIFGICMAFLRESLDKNISSGKALTETTGLPILGRIPAVKRKDKSLLGMFVHTLPNNPVSEAYRILAANIQLISKRFDERIILITSVNMGDGKSITASNIACAYAQMGKRVLLIDADLRRPKLHKILNLDNGPGLSDYLKDEVDFIGITRTVTNVDGLFAISAGQVSEDPVSLLSNERMKYLTEQGAKFFDYVIIDSPPVIGFADALLLSSISTSTLVVVKQDNLNTKKTQTALAKLMMIKPNVLGFLLVKAKHPEAKKQFYVDYDKTFPIKLATQ